MRRVVSLAVICPAGAWVRAGAEGKWLSGVRMDSSGRLQLIRPGISYASEDAKLRWRVPARVSKKIIHEFGSGGQGSQWGRVVLLRFWARFPSSQAGYS